MKLLSVERVNVTDDEAVVEIRIRRPEVPAGTPYLRTGEMRLSWGAARELRRALDLVMDGLADKVGV